MNMAPEQQGAGHEFAIRSGCVDHMRHPHACALSARILCAAIAVALAASWQGAAFAQSSDRPGTDPSVGSGVQNTPAGGGGSQGWQVTPEISTGIAYDSNIYATPNQPQGDRLLMISPSLRLQNRATGTP